ncbi:MAG TPA: starch synthase, partial [Ruminococcaceae bacterium]|nr:starch synthase [Oscillospiraceae bacterium]
MKILFAASEALPFIASGGLADVAGALPKALCENGVDCRVILPLYSGIKQQWRERMTYLTSFSVPLGWRRQYCGVFTAEANGVTYYFVG